MGSLGTSCKRGWGRRYPRLQFEGPLGQPFGDALPKLIEESFPGARNGMPAYVSLHDNPTWEQPYYLGPAHRPFRTFQRERGNQGLANLSLSPDVRAMHVNTGGETTRLIRERWRSSADGVALEVLPDENGLSAALHDPELVIVVPTVATGPRLLYPIANWTALRDARRWRAHARAVVTLPDAA